MDVYDEVDRRENDAGEPGGHGSLGQRGWRPCQPGRAGTWVALSPGLGRGAWLGLLGRPARESCQLGAQQPRPVGRAAELEAASLLLSLAPWTGAPLRPVAALSGSLPSPAPPLHPSFLAIVDSSPEAGGSLLFCCQSPAGLTQPFPGPNYLCSEYQCWGPFGPGKELRRQCSGPPAPACPAGPAPVDSPPLPLPHSVAGDPEPQHPGDRAQRRALPASEPRVLSHTESGELAGWGLGPSLPLLGHHCGALPFPSGRQAIVCCSSPLLAEALPWPLARPGLWLTLASGSVMWEWGGGCSFEPSVSSPWALPSF